MLNTIQIKVPKPGMTVYAQQTKARTKEQRKLKIETCFNITRSFLLKFKTSHLTWDAIKLMPLLQAMVWLVIKTESSEARNKTHRVMSSLNVLVFEADSPLPAFV